MKLIPVVIAFLGFLNTSIAQELIVQDSLLSANDSASTPDYYASNFLLPQSKLTHSNASIYLNNKSIFRLNAGLNVLSVARGQVGNLGISPSSSVSGVLLRGNEATVVVDGVPVSETFASFYNFNSAEYESVSVVSSNSNVTSGSHALDGAMFIASRTGEGHDEGTFEFNSYTTMGWNNPQKFFTADPVNSKFWNINNGLAYMQDFGVIDTRVSFNYGLSPIRTFSDANSHTASLRINTGFDIHPMLNMRLILDRRYSFTRTKQAGTTFRATSWSEDDLGQGTLLFNLKPADWVEISIHNTLTEIDWDYKSSTSMSTSTYEHEQNRKFHKALITFFPSRGRKLNSTVYAGVQQENIDAYFEMGSFATNGNINKSWSKFRLRTTSTVAGLTLGFHDYLFADVNLRRDKQSYLPPDHNEHDVKIAGLSFIFSKALDIDSHTFSLGRIRGTLGDAERTGAPPYPYAEIPLQGLNTPPSSEKSRELGIDLGFLNNRLTLSVAYFKRDLENLYTIVSVPWSPVATYVNIGELQNSGWEVTVAATPVVRDDLRLDNRLIWTKGKAKVINDDQNGGNSISFGNVTPEWTATLFNQFSWKRLFATALIDVRKGGDIISGYDPEEGPLVIDGSYGKVRELGVGFQLGAGKFSRWGVRHVSVSVVGRNLLSFYTPTGDDDVEEAYTTSYIKSVSAGLSVTF